MESLKVYVLLLSVVYGSAYILMGDDDVPEDEVLNLPTEFYFRAETIDLVNSYVEPYEVWYSANYNKTRVSYYDDTYVEYYTSETEETLGAKYTVFYKTTESERNQKVCIEEMFSSEIPDFLPSPGKYKKSGKITLNGKELTVWTKGTNKEISDISGVSTLYTRRDGDADVPFRLITKVDNTLNGAVEAHTLENFHEFYFNVTEDDVTCSLECEDETKLKITGKFHHPKHIEQAFESYKKRHNKEYHQDEEELRKQIFHRNWRQVMNHNKKDLGYKMELNYFSDRTPEELKRYTGTRPSDPSVKGTIAFPYSEEELMALEEELPESYDLRMLGYLGPIKNQGNCGSCWAFTVTATVEGMISKFWGGRNLDLSEQSLVDCAWGFENMGCNGGQLENAYQYVLKHGIPKESEYGPYIRKDGICKLNDTTTFKIKGFGQVSPNNPTALKVALVKYGPVAVAIHASSNMYKYANGIFYDVDCEETHPNHGVVVVGYGERDGTPYWIVRNSWGEDFGLDGYILMSQINNNCNVMDTPFYPIV